MEKLLIALKSRTTWTIVLIFVINGFEGVEGLLSPTLVQVLNPLLTALAVYFRVNPKAGVKENDKKI